MEPDGWPPEWHRAILWACVLRTIQRLEGAAYGYEIGNQLAERHLGAVGGGTLYPLLKRLEAEGLVVAQWRDGDSGPGRKHYRVTDRGRSRLADVISDWNTFTTISMVILEEV